MACNRDSFTWSIHGTGRCPRNPMSPWDVTPFFSSRRPHFMRKSASCHDKLNGLQKTHNKGPSWTLLVPLFIACLNISQVCSGHNWGLSAPCKELHRPSENEGLVSLMIHVRSLPSSEKVQKGRKVYLAVHHNLIRLDIKRQRQQK
jgi:hypothetical protein